MGRRDAARRGHHAARHRPGDAGAQPLGRAAVAAVGSQGIRRRERALARRPGAAPRHRQSVRAPRGRGGRSARGVRAGAGAARFERNAPSRLARRKPPAGARPSVHGARIPAPMTPRPGSIERGEPMTFNLHAATRRELLIASGTLFAWAYLPKVARAEGRDPRLLVIVLRGALDGLAAVAPVGDPDWPALRGNNALTLDGKPAALPLDSFFALNPAMPNLHRLYTSGAAAIVHAAATPYRERSHFDGQDVLESGLPKPGAADSGWLNRALASLQPAGPAGRPRHALAIGPLPPPGRPGPGPGPPWAPRPRP